MQTERRVATNPQTKPTDLGCESADKWMLPSTSTIAICYYYSARKLILILPSHGGWKAESTDISMELVPETLDEAYRKDRSVISHENDVGGRDIVTEQRRGYADAGWMVVRGACNRCVQLFRASRA